jgi:hypothetical protein
MAASSSSSIGREAMAGFMRFWARYPPTSRSYYKPPSSSSSSSSLHDDDDHVVDDHLHDSSPPPPPPCYSTTNKSRPPFSYHYYNLSLPQMTLSLHRKFEHRDDDGIDDEELDTSWFGWFIRDFH